MILIGIITDACKLVLSHDQGIEWAEEIDPLNSLFVPMLRSLWKTDIDNLKIIQGRSFLQFPLNLKDKTPDTPHIDLDQGKEHIVLFIMFVIVMVIQYLL